MRLHGRGRVVDEIQERLGGPVECAVLVAGRPGSGRSSVLEELHRLSPVPVGLAAAAAPQADWPLSGLSAALSLLPAERLAEVGPPDPDRPVAELVERLVQALKGRPDPFWLLIDDLDLMDAQSRQVLGAISGRLSGTGLRLVAATARPLPEVVARSVVTLRQLSLHESELLLQDRAGPGAEPGALRILAGQGGGVPGSLVQLLDRVDDRVLRGREPVDLPRAPLPPPADVQTFVADLSPGRLRALRLLALQPRLPQTVLTRMSQEAQDHVQDLVDEGAVRLAQGHLEIADPVVRGTVHLQMDAGLRRMLRDELLPLLGEDDGTLRLWCTALQHPDPALVPDLFAAAADLVRQGQVAAAAEFAEHALLLGAAPDLVLPVLNVLVWELITHGELAVARHYLALAPPVAEATPDSLGLADARLMLDVTWSDGVDDARIDALVEEHERLGPGRSQRLLTLIAYLHTERSEVEQARRRLEQAKAAPPQPGSHQPGLFPGPHGAGQEAAIEGVELVLKAIQTGLVRERPAIPARGPRTAGVPGYYQLAVARALSLAERYEEVRHRLTALVEATPSTDPLWLELAHFHLAKNEFRAGEFRRASELGRHWKDSLPVGQPVSGSRLLLLLQLTANGRRGADLDQLIARCREVAVRERYHALEAELDTLLGRLALSTQDWAGAQRLLHAVQTGPVQYANPNLLRFEPDLVEALMMDGDLERARAVSQAFAERVRACPSRWGGLAVARCRAMLAEPEQVPARLAEAAAMAGPGDSPYEQGRTWLALARRLETLGLVADSEDAYRAASREFLRSGALVMLAATELRLRSSSPRRRVSSDPLLSDDERQLVDLVAQGHRNREIAQLLYVSVRTVELRLTQIYRKLGVRSRSQLVAGVTQLRPADPVPGENRALPPATSNEA